MPKVKDKELIGGFKKIAMKKGEEKRDKEIAKKMLAKGEEIEKIMEYTELTREKIEELKKSLE